MAYLLNVLYCMVLIAAAPWLIYQSVRTGKYREGFAAKFFGFVPRRTSTGTCVWLHAVSVGEVNLLAPLLAEMRRRHPDWQFFISSTTKTGFHLAQKKYADCTVFYCPLDFSWAVNQVFVRIRPNMLILAELELWPNLIRQASLRGVKVAVVNGRLSERSFKGYWRVRGLLAPLLRRIDLIASQSAEYADRFMVLGAKSEAVYVTGSMKFDNAVTDRQNVATCRLAELAGYRTSDTVFLAGSTQKPEESLAIETYRTLRGKFPNLRLVIVPRHAERFEEVAQLLTASGLSWQRRTALSGEAGKLASPQILLVDTIGELNAWWGLATIAFVGGSLGNRGGQNMLEPAAYGTAVCFGPNTRNFRDIVTALLANDAAAVVQDGHELTSFVDQCLREPAFARTLGSNAQSVVCSQLGATNRTADRLDELFYRDDKLPDSQRKAA